MSAADVELREAKVLRLEPGDTIVVGTPGRVSSHQLALLREQCEEHFPGHKVVVLTDGIRLEVVRVQAASA